MTPANDNETARLMTKTEAAAYCSTTIPTFNKWLIKGWIPPALPMRKWDRKALNLALDKLSGLIDESKPEDTFDKWKRERDARKAQRAG